jgi:hypothetical protein
VVDDKGNQKWNTKKETVASAKEFIKIKKEWASWKI